MNVSLGEKWENFVDQKVKSGDFQTSSEVLREGLRLLENEELLKRMSVSSMADLESKLVEAAKSIDAGKGVDAEAALGRLRARRKAKLGNF